MNVAWLTLAVIAAQAPSIEVAPAVAPDIEVVEVKTAPPPAKTRVLLLPIDGAGLSPADAGDYARRVQNTIADAEHLELVGGREGTLAAAETVGEDLPGCRSDDVCIAEVGRAFGADLVLVARVDDVAGSKHITGRSVRTDDDQVAATVNTLLEGDAEAIADSVRTWCGTLLPSVPGAVGALVVTLSEEGAELLLDGSAIAPGTFDLAAGPHILEARLEGFESLRTVVLVPAGGELKQDMTLQPTDEYLSSYKTVNWAIRGTSLAGVAAGVLTAALGGAMLGASWYLAGVTTTAIEDNNKDPKRTAESQAALQQQVLGVHALTGTGIAALVAGVALVPPAVVLFFFSDDPGRYD